MRQKTSAVLVEKLETSGKFTKMLPSPSLSLVSLSVSSTWLVKNASTSSPEKVFLADCEVFPKDSIFFNTHARGMQDFPKISGKTQRFRMGVFNGPHQLA